MNATESFLRTARADAAPTAPLVQLKDVHLSFGDNAVLKGIDVEVRRGEAVSIIGPSGSGKSTVLRCITGLLRPQRGEILVGDTRVDTLKSEADLIALRKRVGFVFQQFNLFPHLTVLQNLTIAPTLVAGSDRASAEREARALLQKVRLDHKENAYPGELSGGQQQRVALARAIVAEPRVLLFDEPLSNLDSELRESLCVEMSRLLRQLGITAVYVTHDRREAELLADRIVHLSAGSIAAVRAVASSSGELV